MAQWMFGSPIHDVYCGLRGFTKELHRELDQRCTGMEFATEMIISATLRNKKVAEVPITLHPDGRKTHAPHLKTFRDGWRTLRFFLLYSPRWLFLIPGCVLIVLGLVGYMVALPRIVINGIIFDAHTLLFSSLFVLLGYQSILFSIFAKTFAITERLLPEDRLMTRFFELVNLERGLIAGFTAFVAGFLLLSMAVYQWWHTNFGQLDYAQTMRLVIPGATLTALGFQTVLSSFLVSLLGIRRK
jgi:hypothetical protein